jgi:hypothetical protein
MNSPGSEFSTTSTPRPPVIFMTSSANSSERESRQCSTPGRRGTRASRGASGGKDLGARPLKLDRGEAHAQAGTRVHQDALAGPEACQVAERVVRGQEGDGRRRRLLEAERGGLRNHQSGARHCEAPEARGRDGEDGVADFEFGHTFSEGRRRVPTCSRRNRPAR